MSIQQMKTRVKEMMAARYGNVRVANVAASDQQIAAAFFVRAQDAAAIRTVCKSGNYMISFRVAGQHTLARIGNGNPCKGHLITEKSIKESAGAYTYDGLSLQDFTSLRGLVGKPVSKDNKQLAAVWKVKPDNTFEAVPLATVRAAIGNENALKQFYTGDYDMHDLLKKVGGGSLNRVLPGTPDEASAIDAFNLAMLKGDPERKSKVDAWVNSSKPGKRLATSEYALIRHGAQTSFISYLLGPGETELHADPAATTIPYENQVNNIDPKICVFAPDGLAFILDGVASIYRYYADNNLLDQIPFYYFFKDLRAVYNAELNGFATDINTYIAKAYD